ncbi:MAG: hypothetical protein ACYDCK_01365 [Thermoplasmatota archaeon]
MNAAPSWWRRVVAWARQIGGGVLVACPHGHSAWCPKLKICNGCSMDAATRAKSAKARANDLLAQKRRAKAVKTEKERAAARQRVEASSKQVSLE